ncbi:MAG: TetR family transcriptional regulator [Deltaproteobacteria bacterium]|nr:TetR family transcriptional regulator [Deltaproteobacteria bacterium]
MADQNTAQKILDAAIRVFAKEGLRGARMHEIARAAGVNQALLHYYFRSKDKLYEEALFSVFSSMIENLAEKLRGGGDPEEKIRRMIYAYIDQLNANPALPRLLAAESLDGGERLKAVFDRIRIEKGLSPPEFIIPFIESGIASGRFRELDPMQTAASVIGMCLFYFIAKPVIHHIWGAPDDADAFITARKEAIVELVLHGIVKKT